MFSVYICWDIKNQEIPDIIDFHLRGFFLGQIIQTAISIQIKTELDQSWAWVCYTVYLWSSLFKYMALPDLWFRAWMVLFFLGVKFQFYASESNLKVHTLHIFKIWPILKGKLDSVLETSFCLPKHWETKNFSLPLEDFDFYVLIPLWPQNTEKVLLNLWTIVLVLKFSICHTIPLIIQSFPLYIFPIRGSILR